MLFAEVMLSLTDFCIGRVASIHTIALIEIKYSCLTLHLTLMPYNSLGYELMAH